MAPSSRTKLCRRLVISRLQRRRRAPRRLDVADERHGDRAVRTHARLDRQLGVLPHVDAHGVVDAEDELVLPRIGFLAIVVRDRPARGEQPSTPTRPELRQASARITNSPRSVKREDIRFSLMFATVGIALLLVRARAAPAGARRRAAAAAVVPLVLRARALRARRRLEAAQVAAHRRAAARLGARSSPPARWSRSPSRGRPGRASRPPSSSPASRPTSCSRRACRRFRSLAARRRAPHRARAGLAPPPRTGAAVVARRRARRSRRAALAPALAVPLAFAFFERKRSATRGFLSIVTLLVVGLCVILTQKSRRSARARRRARRLLRAARSACAASSSAPRSPLPLFSSASTPRPRARAGAPGGPLGLARRARRPFLSFKTAARPASRYADDRDAAVARTWARALLAALAGLAVGLLFVPPGHGAVFWIYTGLAGAL